MKAARKKPTKKQAVNFEPGVVALLIAIVAVLSLVLLAYLGAIFS